MRYTAVLLFGVLAAFGFGFRTFVGLALGDSATGKRKAENESDESGDRFHDGPC